MQDRVFPQYLGLVIHRKKNTYKNLITNLFGWDSCKGVSLCTDVPSPDFFRGRGDVCTLAKKVFALWKTERISNIKYTRGPRELPS